MKQKFKVLIIGAGNIGAFYDRPTSKNILTHAHAFSRNGFKLVGFVDINLKKASKASRIWGCRSFSKIEDAFNNTRVDVVCVAVPDEKHYAVLTKLLNYNFRLAFVEKPFTTSLEKAQEIISMYRNKKIEIAVNYSRRFLPEFELLRKKIINNYFGNYVTGLGLYGKGLLHNGSHMIDLLRYFFGDVDEALSYDHVNDFINSDPSISAILRLSNGSHFVLQHINRHFYTIFDFDLFFERGRIKINGSKFCIEEYEVKKNNFFPTHQNLVNVGEEKTSQNRATYFAAKNIYDFLATGQKLKSTASNAISVIEICFKIKKSIKWVKK